MSSRKNRLTFGFGLLIAAAIVSADNHFALIEKRILKLKQADVIQVGNIKTPIYQITYPPLSLKDGISRQNIFLSAGAHGDEPAGVYAVLEFLEKDAIHYSNQFRFFVFPCLNPTGFEISANNASGENINRQFFETSKSLETQAVMNSLKKLGHRFLFTIDLHEIPPYWEDEGWKKSDNPRAAYLYETTEVDALRIGAKMVRNLPPDIEVCPWKSIYGDEAKNGVVTYPQKGGNVIYARGTTFDSYLYRLYSKHTFTVETPIGWPLEKRVRAHISWIKTALELKGAVAPLS